jgi:ribonuclease HII
MKQKWVIGIDEAGRGPLAGPVAVGVVLVPSHFDWEIMPGVNDSKQLTPAKREAIFRRAKELKTEGRLDFAVAMVSPNVIDTKGIVFAIALAMSRGLTSVLRSRGTLGKQGLGENGIERSGVLVKLDGGLLAPKEFVHQETIIKGDQKEKVIGLASILAKVTRDRYMERLGKRSEYVKYDLAVHKGYGTRAHRQAIKKYGCTDIHRHSYCKNIQAE